jgi:hypothetical protein
LTRFQSYGVWQKSIVCYFVIAAVIHHDILKRGARSRGLANAAPIVNDPNARALR